MVPSMRSFKVEWPLAASEVTLVYVQIPMNKRQISEYFLVTLFPSEM